MDDVLNPGFNSTSKTICLTALPLVLAQSSFPLVLDGTHMDLYRNIGLMWASYGLAGRVVVLSMSAMFLLQR